jgi:hypothetical protein
VFVCVCVGGGGGSPMVALLELEEGCTGAELLAISVKCLIMGRNSVFLL